MDIRQTPLWENYLIKLGWQVAKLSGKHSAFLRKIPLLGTVIKIPRISAPIPFEEIDKLATDNKSLFVKLEPNIEVGAKNSDFILQELISHGFALDSWALSHTATLQIDLTGSEEELLKSLEKDTRYNIRLAQRSKVVVKQTDNLDEFKELYYQTAKRNRFWVASKELETLWETFYRQGCSVILSAYREEELLASVLLIWFGKIGCYQHAASGNQYRKLMAPYLLLWESLRFLKKKGCSVFDLEGVYDARIKSTRRWQGFTLFKRGFGGREVKYLGSFVKYYNPLAKIIFSLTRWF